MRPATAADAPAIAALHVASWRDAYAHILAREFLNGGIEADRLAVWSERLGNPLANQSVDVACDRAGVLQGFICCYRGADPIWGSLIDNLHVRPEARGHRIGERLLRDAADRLAATAPIPGFHLWVFEANVAGRRFYTRLGGRVVESDRSRTPAAGGKTVLRMHWLDRAQLLER